MKTCTKCRESLPTDQFHRDARAKDGLQSWCKACQAVRYAANPEKFRARDAAYRTAHPDKVAAQKARRRARKAGAAGTFSTEQWLARLDYYGGKCIYCGTTDNIQIEHRIPLSRGGTNWPSNLVPACGSCNSKKNTKTEKEYLTLLQSVV